MKRREKAPPAAELTPYVPKRMSETRLGRERPVTGYLDPERRAAFDVYLDRVGLGVSECLRWLIVDAVRTNRQPPDR